MAEDETKLCSLLGSSENSLQFVNSHDPLEFSFKAPATAGANELVEEMQSEKNLLQVTCREQETRIKGLLQDCFEMSEELRQHKQQEAHLLRRVKQLESEIVLIT